MQDALGDRMKSSYENRTRHMLPRRTYTLLRLDGKSFHTYTRGLKKPFDGDLFADIDTAIINMLPELQGAVFAYTQSDEISVLLTDFATIQTDAWFDGNLQKMCSVAASIMTAQFNAARISRIVTDYMNKYDYPDSGELAKDVAYFDARVFTIPDRIEVMNYFIWRNQDCVRNAVSMVAQSLYSHNQLHGKSTVDMHEMIHQAGKNWATDYSDGEKNGRIIIKEEYQITPEEHSRIEGHPGVFTREPPPALITRTRWVSKGAWKFTEDKEKLLAMIPQYPV